MFSPDERQKIAAMAFRQWAQAQRVPHETPPGPEQVDGWLPTWFDELFLRKLRISPA